MKKIIAIGIVCIMIFSAVFVFTTTMANDVPETRGKSSTLHVSNEPTQVTFDDYYERGQSIVYDGSNYWLFYGRSVSVTGNYEDSNPDINDYQIYYKKANSIIGLAGASPHTVTGADNCYLGETGSASYDGDIWAFGTKVVDSTATLYGWYSSDDGTTWNQVTIATGLPDGAAHHEETTFDNKLWVAYTPSSLGARWHTMTSTDPTDTGSWSTLSKVHNTPTNGLANFYIEDSSLYIAIAANDDIAICKWSGASWSEIDIVTTNCAQYPDHYYDPTLFKIGDNYYFVVAPLPWGWSYQWIEAFYGPSLNNLLSRGKHVTIDQSRYGKNTWISMWPTGFTDENGDAYLFYTSERNPEDLDNEITGNIWLISCEVGWYFHPQDAVNAANTGDTIMVHPGVYGSRRVSLPQPPHWKANNDKYAPALIVYKDDLTIKAADPDPSRTVIESTHDWWSNPVAVQASTGGSWDGTQYINAGLYPSDGSAPNAVSIIASGVKIQGFTLRKPYMEVAWDGFWNTAGVMIGGLYAGDPYNLGSDGNSVKKCVFEDVWHAVYIWHSSKNRIVNNEVRPLGSTEHWAAIEIYDGYNDEQINLGYTSKFNKIINNDVADKGIFVGAWPPSVWADNEGTQVHGNTATGIFTAYSEGRKIFSGNAVSWYGAYEASGYKFPGKSNQV